MSFQDLYAERIKFRQPSIIRELLPLAGIPGMISLAGGYPHPGTFPISSARIDFGGIEVVLEGAALEAGCQYGPSPGLPRLIEHILRWHKVKTGAGLTAQNVCVLTGSQEGLFLLSHLFLDPGDAVAMTEPAYPGALAAFRCFTDNLIAVPQDREGMDARALEEVLTRRRRKSIPLPKLLYLNPNCHNPAGISMSLARREQILGIADAFDLVVIDDDPYEMLKFKDEDRITALQVLDRGRRVIRLDSFSKVLVPGFRLGYLSGPPEILTDIRQIKGTLNLHSSSFDQAILAQYFEQVGIDGFLAHIRHNCERYHASYRSTVEAIREHLGPRVRFEAPDGGFFIWMEILPGPGNRVDARRMVEELSPEVKVLVVPGSGFSLGGCLDACIRISFSQQDPEVLTEGIARLSELIRRHGEQQ